jgi:hypothetical protein
MRKQRGVRDHRAGRLEEIPVDRCRVHRRIMERKMEPIGTLFTTEPEGDEPGTQAGTQETRLAGRH